MAVETIVAAAIAGASAVTAAIVSVWAALRISRRTAQADMVKAQALERADLNKLIAGELAGLRDELSYVRRLAREAKSGWEHCERMRTQAAMELMRVKAGFK